MDIIHFQEKILKKLLDFVNKGLILFICEIPWCFEQFNAEVDQAWTQEQESNYFQ